MGGFKFTDHSAEVLRALEENEDAALEALGLAAEGYAKANITRFPRVDTGRLRNSISHSAQKDAVYIGTNVEYASYVEFGTGPLAGGTAADGTQIVGRQDVPWFYKDAKGKGHISYGMAPAHYLKNAVTEHKSAYQRILTNYLKGKG